MVRVSQFTLSLLSTLFLFTCNGAYANLYQETTHESTISCVITPSKSVDIASPVAGVIAKHYVDRGDKIEQGQRLFDLMNKPQQAKLALAQAKTHFLKRKVDRNQELLQEELISSEEADELETDYELAKLEAKLAEVELELHQINSPITGYVTERGLDEGELVGEKPVFTLVTIHPLYAEVVLTEEVFGQYSLNQKLSFILGIPNNKTVKGKVIAVDPVIDASSGTFSIRVEINNDKHRIPAGQKCALSSK